MRRSLLAPFAVAAVAASAAADVSSAQGLGDPVPNSVRVRPALDPDPDGGPPWGIRTFETTTGASCDQIGRVLESRLGAVDERGAFHEAPLRADSCVGRAEPDSEPRSWGMQRVGRRTLLYGTFGRRLVRVLVARADWTARRDLYVSPEGEYVAVFRGSFNDASQPRLRLWFDGGCGPQRRALLAAWPRARVEHCQVVVPLDEPRPARESAASRRARRHPSRPSPVRSRGRLGVRYRVPITVGPDDAYAYRLSGPRCAGGDSAALREYQDYERMVRGRWDELPLRPAAGAAWCRGVYRVALSFVSGARAYRPFGAATFRVR